MNFPALARLVAAFRALHHSPPNSPAPPRESTGRRVGPTLQEQVIRRRVTKVTPAWRWAIQSSRKVRRAAR